MEPISMEDFRPYPNGATYGRLHIASIQVKEKKQKTLEFLAEKEGAISHQTTQDVFQAVFQTEKQCLAFINVL